MNIQKSWNLFLICVVPGLIAPAIALAEPGVSHAHVPYLWALATGLSAGLAFGIIKVIRSSKLLRTPLRRWGLGIVLFAASMMFLVPIILIFGGILITGRTM